MKRFPEVQPLLLAFDPEKFQTPLTGYFIEAPELVAAYGSYKDPLLPRVKEMLLDRFPGIISVRPRFGMNTLHSEAKSPYSEPLWLVSLPDGPTVAEVLTEMRDLCTLEMRSDDFLEGIVRWCFIEGKVQLCQAEIRAADLEDFDLRSCAAVAAARHLQGLKLASVDGDLIVVPQTNSFGPAQELALWPPRMVRWQAGKEMCERRILGRLTLESLSLRDGGAELFAVGLKISTIVDRPLSPHGDRRLRSIYGLVRDQDAGLRLIKLPVKFDRKRDRLAIDRKRIRYLAKRYGGFDVPELEDVQRAPLDYLTRENRGKPRQFFMLAAPGAKFEDGTAMRIKGVNANEEGLAFVVVADRLKRLGFRPVQARPLGSRSQVEMEFFDIASLVKRALPGGADILLIRERDAADGEHDWERRHSALEEKLSRFFTARSLEIYDDAERLRVRTAEMAGVASLDRGELTPEVKRHFRNAFLERIDRIRRPTDRPQVVVTTMPRPRGGQSSRKELARIACGTARLPLQVIDPRAFWENPPVFEREVPEQLLELGHTAEADRYDKMPPEEKSRWKLLVRSAKLERRQSHVLGAVYGECLRQLGVQPLLPVKKSGLFPYEGIVVWYATGLRVGARARERSSGIAVYALRFRLADPATQLAVFPTAVWQPLYERGLELAEEDAWRAGRDAWVDRTLAGAGPERTLSIVCSARPKERAGLTQTLAAAGAADVLEVIPDGIKVIGGKSGFFYENLDIETYRRHEAVNVSSAAEGLHHIGDALFLSVAERSSQMQKLAKKHSRRLLASDEDFFDYRRGMRPKGYLLSVAGLSTDADPAYVAMALHTMRRLEIPGCGVYWTLPSVAHFATKLAEWAGYEEPDDYEADVLSEEDENTLSLMRESGWVLALKQGREK